MRGKFRGWFLMVLVLMLVVAPVFGPGGMVRPKPRYNPTPGQCAPRPPFGRTPDLCKAL